MTLRSILRPYQKNFLNLRNYSETNNGLKVTINDKTKIATITMNRKPVNALNTVFLTDINETFKSLEGKVKGAILTSALPTIFSGGLDIKVMYKPKKENVAILINALQKVWIRLLSTSYPTVAVINGHALAGGCVLSMCCEYRIMVNNFTIGMTETKLGLVPPFWTRDIMRSIIGYRETELALTSGKSYSTEEAFKVGLVDEKTTSKEESLIKAEEFFKRFNNVNPMARNLTKISLHQKMIDDLRKKQVQDADEFASHVVEDDIQKMIENYLKGLKKKSEK